MGHKLSRRVKNYAYGYRGLPEIEEPLLTGPVCEKELVTTRVCGVLAMVSSVSVIFSGVP